MNEIVDLLLLEMSRTFIKFSSLAVDLVQSRLRNSLSVRIGVTAKK